MKTKVLLAAVAVAFSFAVTSCGNKKAAETAADACCARTEQCDSCKAAGAECKGACGEKKNCEHGGGHACEGHTCDHASDNK